MRSLSKRLWLAVVLALFIVPYAAAWWLWQLPVVASELSEPGDIASVNNPDLTVNGSQAALSLAPELSPARRIIYIAPGTAVSKVYQLVAEQSWISRSEWFQWLDPVFGGRGSFQTGEFAFSGGESFAQVARKLRSFDVVEHDLLIPEGWTVKQIVNRLNGNELLSGEIKQLPAEGSLFPATYKYTRNMSRVKLLSQMQRRMRQELASLRKIVPDFDAEKIIIMASLIEREAVKDSERDEIASVFYNRLRLGYRLQSDPTVIYQLSGGQGSLGRKLLRSDLKIDGPHNTYTNYGLPPTAIGNPGRASLLAALMPAKSDLLYFVADGKGGHRFAKNLQEHNRNARMLREYLAGKRDN